jgi:hypothetical protein
MTLCHPVIGPAVPVSICAADATGFFTGGTSAGTGESNESQAGAGIVNPSGQRRPLAVVSQNVTLSAHDVNVSRLAMSGSIIRRSRATTYEAQ